MLTRSAQTKRHIFRMIAWVGMLATCVHGAEVMAADQQTARGILRAGVDTVISTELVAQVVSLPIAPGDRFEKGDVLVRFDCARYDAERRAAAAELKMSRLEVTSNEKLLRHDAIGSTEVEISRAKREQMTARLDALLVRERQCNISAPFPGRMVERHLQLHELSKPNAPLIRLVNRELEIDLIVPSQWINWLRIGMDFDFHVEEKNISLKAQVQRVGAIVDPVSRTLRIVGRLIDTTTRVLPGMSGVATFRKAEK